MVRAGRGAFFSPSSGQPVGGQRFARLASKAVVALMCCIFAVPFGCTPERGSYRPPFEHIRHPGLKGTCEVAADHDFAEKAGFKILGLGGNAVDAAVAVSFVLAVVHPEDCGLGGGGFAIYSEPGKESVVVDFREEAPAAAERKQYLDREGTPISGISTIGSWAVGIPGQVKGALELWNRSGSGLLTLETVMEPAITIAETGFPVDQHLHNAMKRLSRLFRVHPDYTERFGETARVFLKEDNIPYEAGEILLRPDLAKTLREIALSGADSFYRGRIGQAIVQELGRLGGPQTLTDLISYQVRFQKPLSGTFLGYRVFSVPPPSSGGAVLLEILNVLERALEEGDSWFRPHLTAEAMKHAFADRSLLLGDRSDAVMQNVTTMLSEERASEILKLINPLTVEEVPQLVEERSDDLGETSHFCVVDTDGGVVSWTESINLSFGSLITVPGTGIVLNNTMDDFSLTTTGVNAFGLKQGTENLLKPGARPLSSMTPVVVFGGDGLRLVAGAAGGPKIISSVLLTAVRVLLDDMPVAKAVSGGRFHHQWVPDVLFVETGIEPEVVNGFLLRGHTLRAYTRAEAGCVQAIEVRNGTLYTAGDR